MATKADHLELPEKLTFLSIDDRERDIDDKCIELETKIAVRLRRHMKNFPVFFFVSLPVQHPAKGLRQIISLEQLCPSVGPYAEYKKARKNLQ